MQIQALHQPFATPASSGKTGIDLLKDIHQNADARARIEKITPRIGEATAPAHVGEICQGVLDLGPDRRRGGDGHHRFLIDLPCTVLGTTAVVGLTPGTGKVVVDPPMAVKAARAVKLALRITKLHRNTDAHVALVSNIPVGHGCGSSSSDVWAALRATFNAAGVALPAAALRMLVLSEHASNPCREDPIAFAHREGAVLQQYGRWPGLNVLGAINSKAEAVDTLQFPPAKYSQEQIAQFGVLEQAACRAFETGDVVLLGEVATASARINEQYLPRLHCGGLSALLAIVAAYGAVGVAVAHSGTAAALLWDACTTSHSEKMEAAERELGAKGYDQFYRWTLN